MLLQEFDPAKRAVINPDQMFHLIPNFPETMVSIFSHQLFDKILEFLGGEKIALLACELACRMEEEETCR